MVNMFEIKEALAEELGAIRVAIRWPVGYSRDERGVAK